jgi:pimeloyl-ACP methyl ester carboxylesterase
MTEPKSDTLDAPGATLGYDVRRVDGSRHPVLLLVGSPMGADGFPALAARFTDRTVVTYDPRGAGRSPRTDGAMENTPEEHADDLRRLIGVVGDAPVDLFATSGGAVNALALVARHPALVRTLVAHEPPVGPVLPDAATMLAACRDIQATYRQHGFGPAMAKFIAVATHDGPLPADYLDRPAPDPAMFGLPTADDGTRDNPLVGLNMITCTHFEPDFEALRAAPTRIVVAVGAASGGELAARGGRAVAERLGSEPVVVPGGHDGFIHEPEAFAAVLRGVLD